MRRVNKIIKERMSNIVCLILCFNLIISLFAPMMLVSADDSDILLAVDNDTMDTYQDALINEENGSMYAGRVWTDKSVFTDDISLDYATDGYDGTITNNSDFLHAFSALGSSQNVISVEKSPLDVVLLLDISTSMTSKTVGQNVKYVDVAEKVIKQANDLISTLMGDDPNYEVNSSNRVAVVLYAGGSQVLLPLDHYQALSSSPTQVSSIISESNKAEIEYLTLDIYDKTKHTSSETDLKASTKYWPKVKTNVTKINKSRIVESDGQIESEFMFADSTYLQGALYQGMNILATEKNTTYTNPKTGKIEQRVPILITLTDGGTNVVGATETNLKSDTPSSSESLSSKVNWWNPLGWVKENNDIKAILPTKKSDNTWERFIASPNGNPFYVTLSGTDDKVKKAISPRTVAVLLTAGFMKKKVEDNYTVNNPNGNKVFLQSYGIGLNVENLSDRELVQLNSTMNPREYIKADVSEEQIKEAYETLEKYIKGESPTLTFNPNYKWVDIKLSASWTYEHPSGKDSKYDIKSIEDVYYIDQYFVADTDSLGDKFKQILYKINGDTFNPIEGFNSYGSENAITYMDPIGQYMEVKDIKNLLLFGKLYDISFDKTEYYIVKNGKEVEYDTKPEKYNYLRKYYKIENNDGGNIINYCYPTVDDKGNVHYNVTFNLDDIEIYVESGKGNKSIESLYIIVPSNALPLQLATINLNRKDSITSYSTNIDDKTNSTPLRVFYEVGLDDSILSNNSIDSSKLSNDYIKNNYKDGYLYFYSNYYSSTNYNDYTADIQDGARSKGDAFSTMSPSVNNRYYIFQNNLKIYKYAYVIGDNGEVVKESNPKFFGGTVYDGEYAGKTEKGQINEMAKNTLRQAFNDGKLTKGDIVTLADDVITYGETTSSDNYYYFAIDYYMPTSGGKGKRIQYVVSRKGSEFGLGLLNGELPKGDFLCWYDANGKYNETYNYDENIPSDKRNNGANWVLATKIGGLRTGDLHQSILMKEENKTGTSKSYYLPVIADNLSTEGSDVILNTYLGNNGLIKYKFSINSPNTKDIVFLFIVFFIINSILLLILLYKKNYFKKIKYQN